MSVPAWAILGAIQALTPCWADRNDPRVPDFQEKMAVAESEECQDIGECAALVTLGHIEGGGCIGPQEHYTHSGALSEFQLEGKRGKYPGPFIGLSYDAIHNAAHAAMDVWRHSGGCGHDIAGHFSVYAGGNRCGKNWPTLVRRVNTYWFVYATISREVNA